MTRQKNTDLQKFSARRIRLRRLSFRDPGTHDKIPEWAPHGCGSAACVKRCREPLLRGNLIRRTSQPIGRNRLVHKLLVDSRTVIPMTHPPIGRQSAVGRKVGERRRNNLPSGLGSHWMAPHQSEYRTEKDAMRESGDVMLTLASRKPR